MTTATRLFRFLWAFVVGDDWRVAGGIVLALGLSALLVAAAVPAWWLMPLAVVMLLVDSLRRAVR